MWKKEKEFKDIEQETVLYYIDSGSLVLGEICYDTLKLRKAVVCWEKNVIEFCTQCTFQLKAKINVNYCKILIFKRLTILLFHNKESTAYCQLNTAYYL